jgi:SAM-dependent methyltransferase
MAAPMGAGEWAALTTEQRGRWVTVLDYLVAAVPGDARLVLVDGDDERAALLADRLAAWLRRDGRHAVRSAGATRPDAEAGRQARAAGTVVVADGPAWRDQVPGEDSALTIWVRTAPVAGGDGGNRGDHANAVVDLHDPGWPVLRHVDPRLIPNDLWYRTESRAFFGIRAASWDAKFGDDLPVYARAIVEAGLAVGGVAVDVGCGTGRALPALREATGPEGVVIGLDHTPQMLAAARDRAATCAARLLLADARRLPFADATVDALFAAGLVNHLPDLDAGLAELARVTRLGGRLVLFHPSGRAALAARHGRVLRPDEPLAEHVLGAAAARTGWRVVSYDDASHRFHAVAVRG